MAVPSPHFHKRKLEDEDSGSDLDFVYPPKKKAPTDSSVFKSTSSFFGNLLGKFVDYISPSPSKPAKQTPGRSKPKNNLYNKNNKTHKSNNNLQFNINKRQRIMSQQGITSPQKNSDNKSDTINDNKNTKVGSPDNDDVILIPLTVYDDLQPTSTTTYDNNPSSSSPSIQPSTSNSYSYSFDQNYSHDSLSPSFQPTILSRNTDKYPTSSSTTSFLDEVEQRIEIDKFADRLNGIVLEDAMNTHISSSSSNSIPRSLSHSLSRSLAPSQALSSIIPVPRTLSSSSLVNKEKRKPLDTSVNDVILLNESAADTSAAFVPVGQTRRVSTRDVQAKRVDESYQEYLVSPAKKSIDKFVTLTREASLNEKQSYNKMVEARLREMGNELGAGKEESLPVLTSEQQAQVTQAFGSHRDDSDEVLSEAFNVQIRREDIRCLKPGDWLNDEVINFYINLLMERNKSSSFTKTKSYIFNTHFYSLLYYNAKKYDYARVRRWTSKIGEDVFKLDKIIIPIHLGMHWCLAVINLKQKRFEYYDSLLSPNDECIGVLRRWLTDEAKKANHPLDLAQWTDHTPKDIPRQKNGFDCGVFMLRFAERASCDKRFDFSQDTMAAMRKIMVHEIITKKAFG